MPRNRNHVADHFDRAELRRVCELHETGFQRAYDLDRFAVDQAAPDDFYLFRDNGASVLAVAHLDTVGRHETRSCNYVETESGTVVYSRALDDRLGAYVILDLLPKLGVDVDILLTVGEESGRSTAAFFEPSKEYDHLIEFDRGGTDVVLYQYDDDATRDLVDACGARVGDGIFSDISELEHLGVKGLNWGVGYQDYHSPRSHAYLDDTFGMVDHYLTFHAQNAGRRLSHEAFESASWLDYATDPDSPDYDPLPTDPRDPFYWSDSWRAS